jgi:glycosyltransferase involved in cell wall biosynthesis
VYGDPEKLPAFGRQLRWLAGGDNRIGLMGAYDNQHLPEILQEIDVLVVPSLWYETGPLVTLEGFACLTPVVVSNIPNMVNQVTDGVDGLVFKVGSVESLANVLQRLIDEPGLLAHLTYGIRPVKSHDEQMQEWMQAYQMALEGRK